MITPEGYTNDPSIRPDGIVITWPPGMWNEPWPVIRRAFEATMKEGAWPHKSKREPRIKGLMYVYIIVENIVVYRCKYLGYVMGPENYELATGGDFYMNEKHILLSGPLVKAPREIRLSGFRGFRYCTELF